MLLYRSSDISSPAHGVSLTTNVYNIMYMCSRSVVVVFWFHRV